MKIQNVLRLDVTMYQMLANTFHTMGELVKILHNRCGFKLESIAVLNEIAECAAVCIFHDNIRWVFREFIAIMNVQVFDHIFRIKKFCLIHLFLKRREGLDITKNILDNFNCKDVPILLSMGLKNGTKTTRADFLVQ